MEIIKQGIDTSRIMRCDVCGCEFKYLPGEIHHETIAIYNVPEECWRENGGTYGPCGVKHYRVVICPCCKTRCEIEDEG